MSGNELLTPNSHVDYVHLKVICVVLYSDWNGKIWSWSSVEQVEMLCTYTGPELHHFALESHLRSLKVQLMNVCLLSLYCCYYETYKSTVNPWASPSASLNHSITAFWSNFLVTFHVEIWILNYINCIFDLFFWRKKIKLMFQSTKYFCFFMMSLFCDEN